MIIARIISCNVFDEHSEDAFACLLAVPWVFSRTHVYSYSNCDVGTLYDYPIDRLSFAF